MSETERFIYFMIIIISMTTTILKDKLEIGLTLIVGIAFSVVAVKEFIKFLNIQHIGNYLLMFLAVLFLICLLGKKEGE